MSVPWCLLTSVSSDRVLRGHFGVRKWFVLQRSMYWKLGPQEATVDNGNFPRWNLVKSSYTSVGVVVLKGIMRLQSKLYCCVISHPPPGTYLP